MQVESFLDGRVSLHSGDCMEAMAAMPESTFDSCITDPPYHLASIVKRYAKGDARTERSLEAHGSQGVSPYMRGAAGFLGKRWDDGDTAFRADTWRAVSRVLKPGGHVLAFGHPRNFGFMQVAMDQAGFEIRDVVAWFYGTGFIKSHSVSRSLEKMVVCETEIDEWRGWGTALKPGYEPLVMARKPLDKTTIARNVLAYGTGAINIGACMVESDTEHARMPANVILEDHPAVRDALEDPEVARFFYSTKATAEDRVGSKHPTVKPLELLRYLCRLVTRKGGIILDPFSGTGTLAQAAVYEGMRAELIEHEEEYRDDIRFRMSIVNAGPEERLRALIKRRGEVQTHDDLPIFKAAA